MNEKAFESYADTLELDETNWENAYVSEMCYVSQCENESKINQK